MQRMLGSVAEWDERLCTWLQAVYEAFNRGEGGGGVLVFGGFFGFVFCFFGFFWSMRVIVACNLLQNNPHSCMLLCFSVQSTFCLCCHIRTIPLHCKGWSSLSLHSKRSILPMTFASFWKPSKCSSHPPHSFIWERSSFSATSVIHLPWIINPPCWLKLRILAGFSVAFCFPPTFAGASCEVCCMDNAEVNMCIINLFVSSELNNEIPWTALDVHGGWVFPIPWTALDVRGGWVFPTHATSSTLDMAVVRCCQSGIKGTQHSPNIVK